MAESVHRANAKIVDSICDTSNEIEKVNAVSHQTVEEMNGFVTLLKEYQEKLHSEAELIQQQIANSNEISERQANYLDKLVESESRVADLADNVKKKRMLHSRPLICCRTIAKTRSVVLWMLPSKIWTLWPHLQRFDRG